MFFEDTATGLLREPLVLNSELRAAETESGLSGFDLAFLIFGILSGLGCIFNIIITFLLKLHKNVLGKMMIFISAGDAIFTLSLAAPYIGIWGSSSFIIILSGATWASSIFWICCFAHALYISVKFGEERINNSLLKKYICISITASVIAGGLFAIFILTGSSSSYRSFYRTFMSVVTNSSILYCVVCYISVFKKLRDYGTTVHFELLVYPLLLIICEFPIAALPIYVSLSNQSTPATLLNIGFLCFMSRGIWNSLAYGLSSKIRHGVKSLCRMRAQGGTKETLLPSYKSGHKNHHGRDDRGMSNYEPNFVLRETACDV